MSSRPRYYSQRHDLHDSYSSGGAVCRVERRSSTPGATSRCVSKGSRLLCRLQVINLRAFTLRPSSSSYVPGQQARTIFEGSDNFGWPPATDYLRRRTNFHGWMRAAVLL
nr:unnamed protein product [Fasciola hepatica]